MSNNQTGNPMAHQKADEIRKMVRDHYSNVATGSAGCGCSNVDSTGCCSPAGAETDMVGQLLGYSVDELNSVVDSANMNLGCGNPLAIARLTQGESVLDLGSGGGFDSFLAAQAVGSRGAVIGVDMTPEMIAKARANGRKMKVENISFRLGEIEHLPVADESVDVILSNCVINLSPDKPRVWQEAYRVLRPGGRLSISDIVATRPIPGQLREQLSLLIGCISGAEQVETIEADLQAAGFTGVNVRLIPQSGDLIKEWFPESGAENYVVSAEIEALKPTPTLAIPEGTEWVKEVSQRAENYMRRYGNCAQSIVVAFSEILQIDAPWVSRASSGFLGGMMHSLTCGVQTGGVMVLGLLMGRDRLEEGQDGLYPIALATQELLQRINDRLGSHSCLELTGVDFTDFRQAVAFSRSDAHEKCFTRVAEGAEVIAEMISELRQKGELP